MTYLFMALGIMAVAAMIDIWVTKQRYILTKQCWLVVLSLIILTLIFNNLIVGLDIVQYREASLLGIRVPFMPIEDLSYAIAAGILVPSLMKYYET